MEEEKVDGIAEQGIILKDVNLLNSNRYVVSVVVKQGKKYLFLE